MPVPTGIIIGWPASVATIPAGWTRKSSLDGRYLRGSAAAGATGGAATHTHEAATHNHIQDSHVHSIALASIAPGGVASGGGTHSVAALATHSHAGSLNSTAAANTSYAAQASNTAATTPDYWDVIWIESDGTPAGLPASAVAWWYDVTLPTGWTQPASGQGRYLKGAAAGAGGGATGGNSSHSHTWTAHTHDSATHTHTGASSHGPSGSVQEIWSGVHTANDPSHTHAITTDPTAIVNQTNPSTAGAATQDPSYHALAIVQNGSGDASLPQGIIAAWLGDADDIPPGWHACDGSAGAPDLDGDVFPKGVTDLDDIGATGGAVDHSHSGSSHSHTQNSHTHTGTSDQGSGFATLSSDGSGPDDMRPHSHDLTLGATTAINQSTTPAIAAASSLPQYAAVIFIQFGALSAIAVARNLYGQEYRIFADAGISFERLDTPGGVWSTPTNPWPTATDGDLECLPDGRLHAAVLVGGAIDHYVSADDGETWTAL